MTRIDHQPPERSLVRLLETPGRTARQRNSICRRSRRRHLRRSTAAASTPTPQPTSRNRPKTANHAVTRECADSAPRHAGPPAAGVVGSPTPHRPRPPGPRDSETTPTTTSAVGPEVPHPRHRDPERIRAGLQPKALSDAGISNLLRQIGTKPSGTAPASWQQAGRSPAARPARPGAVNRALKLERHWTPQLRPTTATKQLATCLNLRYSR